MQRLIWCHIFIKFKSSNSLGQLIIKNLNKMKRILLLASIFVLTTSIAFSATLTVNSHPLGGAQYSSLEAAYNDAVNGDILIIEGTDIKYSMTWGWNKSRTVIGAGIDTNKQFFKRIYFSNNNNYPITLPNLYLL